MRVAPIICATITIGIRTRHQSGSGWPADRLGVETCKLHPFFRHLVYHWGFNIWRAIATEILVPLVISENNDEVRWTLRNLFCRSTNRNQGQRDRYE